MAKEKDVSKKQPESRIIKGRGLSHGSALGKAFVYRDILSRKISNQNISYEQIPQEMKRTNDAIDYVSKDLQKMKNVLTADISKGYGNIAEVHKMILKDKSLLTDIRQEIKGERLNAERAIKNVFRRKAGRLRESRSPVTASKGDDLDDLSRRLIHALLGYTVNELEKLPKNTILIAPRLLPSDTVNINKEHIQGIIVEEGTPESHSAILARAMGIPIIHCPHVTDFVTKGDRLLMDAEKGEVILRPNKTDLKKHLTEAKLKERREKQNLRTAKRMIRMKDGSPVYVYANCSSRYDSDHAVVKGCDGIGLVRTEQLYLSTRNMPDENYLVEKLEDIIKPLGKKSVTIRLLDIGSDKKLPYLNIEEEINPDLGLRGVRVLLKYTNLLKTQVNAFLRLFKKYKIRMLIPMITVPEEVTAIRKVVEDCVREYCEKNKIKKFSLPIGAMIETPAAVENINAIAKVSDFLSIGSNDLIQYTMVAGREDPSVAKYFENGIPVVMRMIKRVIDAAHRKNIECCLCGELAGDLRWTEKLLKIRLKSFSVSPFIIPELKEKIRANLRNKMR